MKKIIYIFGNPALETDNLPLKLINELGQAFSEIEFKYIDPNENLKPDKGELMVIDTALGVKEVTVIKNIDQIASPPAFTMHDFDLAANLKLLDRLGILKKFTIFAVPPNIKKSAALKQLINKIKYEMRVTAN